MNFRVRRQIFFTCIELSKQVFLEPKRQKELERAIQIKFDIRKRLRFGSLDELFKPWLILADSLCPHTMDVVFS